MKLSAIFIDGTTGDKDFDIESQGPYTNVRRLYIEKKENSCYSIWSIDMKDKQAQEDVSISKDEKGNLSFEKGPFISEYFTYNNIMYDKKLKMEMIYDIFGGYFYAPYFNTIKEITMDTIYYIATDNNKGDVYQTRFDETNLFLLNGEEIYDMDDMEPITVMIKEKIKHEDCVFYIKHASSYFSYAYIERTGADETITRIFSFGSKEYFHPNEHSRIITRGDESIFLRFSRNKWIKCEPLIKEEGMNFLVIGRDDLTGTHAGRIMDRFDTLSRDNAIPYNSSLNSGEYLMLSLINHAFENVIELKCWSIVKRIKNIRQKPSYIYDGASLLGDVNKDAKSFAGFLNLPSYIIPLLDESGYHLYNFLSGPISNYYREYVRNNNRELGEDITKMLLKICCTMNSGDYNYVLTNLQRRCNDFFGNVQYFYNITFSYGSGFKYIDYLSMFVHFDEDEIKNFRFKLKPAPHEISQEHDRAIALVNQKKNMIKENIKEKFKETSEENLSYAYKGSNMSVVVPKEANELLKEGAELCHCVSTYIDSVALGKTIVLFIRRNNELNKPFYTLEIRDGRVRQCHGKCNIKADEEVKVFLKEYCKEKNIIYTDGEMALAV